VYNNNNNNNNNNNVNNFNSMTEYGPWVLQWHWSYVRKFLEWNAANLCGHRNDSYFVVWVTDELQAVEERLLCVELVTSRYLTSTCTCICTLMIATLLIHENLLGFNTCIRFNIMVTNTHHCYLPKLVHSFLHHDIQFSKVHLII